MRQQRLNVIGSLAQRRHGQVDDAQPVQQVFTELTGRDVIGQVPVGRGDHADVDARLRVVRADGLDLAVLEKPQEQRLHPQAHFADFVEEQRAPVRELELPPLVAVGAGEAALHVSEELRLQQRLGEAGAVHRHERRQLACRTTVDIACDQILADAALARDQRLGGAFCRAGSHREQFRHRTAGDDQAGVLRDGLDGVRL